MVVEEEEKEEEEASEAVASTASLSEGSVDGRRRRKTSDLQKEGGSAGRIRRVVFAVSPLPSDDTAALAAALVVAVPGRAPDPAADVGLVADVVDPPRLTADPDATSTIPGRARPPPRDASPGIRRPVAL